MPREDAEDLAKRVRCERGARRAAFLAPDLLPVELEDVVGLDAQKRDLVFREAVRKKDVALLVEGPQLLVRQSHGRSPWYRRPVSGSCLHCRTGRAKRHRLLRPDLTAMQHKE